MDNRLPDDTAVAAVVARWEDSLRARLGPERVIGQTAVPIDARDALGRQQESLLGDLVTDAMRAGTAADVAVLAAPREVQEVVNDLGRVMGLLRDHVQSRLRAAM